MTIIRKRKSEVFFLLYEINSLSHSGIRGMRWGRRRYQNEDGSLTPMGRQHYGVGNSKDAKRYLKAYKRAQRTQKAIDRTYNRQERDLYDARALANERGNIRAYNEWDKLNNKIDMNYYYDKEPEYDARSKKYGKESADKWFDESLKREMLKKQRTKKFAADWVDRKSPAYADEEYSRLYDKIGDKYADTRSRMTTMRNRAQDTVDYYEPRAYNYDRRIERAYNQSFAKAQRKWEKQQARRQFASSIASIAGQRLADYAVDAAVGAVSKQLNKAILDNKPSKGRYDYRQDVINTKKSLKSHLKDTVSSGKRVMTEAKLAPSYKNLYNRLKASGRVSSFNQFLNEVYYPDLERRR